MMLNWRKPAFHAVMSLAGYPAYRYLRFLKSIEYKSPEELLQLQNEKLRQLLEHANKYVPYYNKILAETAVVKNNRIILENLSAIPPLTKEIIRRQGENLYSADYKKRKWYLNTSGGSTGQPVQFMQDRNCQSWDFACRFYYNLMAGKDVGEPELLLWGSERDILGQKEKLSTTLRRWIFNKKVLNSFMMSTESMKSYARLWNSFKPKMVWAYTSSIFEFARYIKNTNTGIFTPASIICTAETLTEDVRGFIEQVFGCPVLNQYGSREVGVIACECTHKEGLHTFGMNNKIEILDNNLQPCNPGQMGRVYITTLNNYSMPLIRYSIGDTAVVSDKKLCSCGRTSPLIATVTGRTSDHFKTRDGRLIHGEYFTHLFYDKIEIRKFRVIQHDYEDIEILAESDGAISKRTIGDLEDRIKLAIGQNCRVSFKQLDQIPPAASGKYRYTISEVAQEE